MQIAPGSNAAVGVDLDTSALRDPIDAAELQEFRRANQRIFGWTAARIRRLVWDVASISAASVSVGIMLLFSVLLLFIALATVLAMDTYLFVLCGWVITPLTALLVVLFAANLEGHVLGRAAPRPGLRRTFRLAGFAADNGLDYSALWSAPTREGSLFAAGERRFAHDVLTTLDGVVEIGNYSFAGGAVTRRALRRFGYIRVELPRPVPHMVVEATANRRVFRRDDLPWRVLRGQRLTLEGDFDRYFSLHVPTGSERDALRLFTPDVMALLIDRFRPFDAEVVDSAVFLYSRRPFAMSAPVTFHRAFAVAEAIRRPTTRFASRWREENPNPRDLSWRVRRTVVRPVLWTAMTVGWIALLIARLPFLH